MASKTGTLLQVTADQEGATPRLVTETEPLPIAVFDGFGVPISSLGGALDIHDSDPHHSVYNQFLHFDTATTTTLDGAVSKGSNQITLTSAVGFAANDEIKIENGGQEPLFFKIMVLNGTLATLDTPLTFDHASGSDVTKICTNLAEPGITAGATISSPVIFTSHVAVGSIVHVTNMSIVITNTAAMDFTKWGGASALINGLVLRAQSNGFVGAFTNWKRNFDLNSDAFPVTYQVKSGGGEYGLSAIYQIKQGTGSIVYLNGALGDAFEAIAQESLEGNTNIKIKLQGHFEGA